MHIHKKLLLAVISLFLVLLVLEAGLRVSGYDPNRSPAWTYDADLGWIHDQSGGVRDLNSHGFRSPEVGEKAPGTKRILVLGDSFTVGSAEPFAATFAGRLPTLADASGGESWEVHSLAVGDWGTVQQLLAFRKFVEDFLPDFVVLQLFPFNDVCNNSSLLAETCSLQDHHRPYLRRDSGGVVIEFGGLSRFSVLARYFENQVVWWLRRREGLDPDDGSTNQAYFSAQSRKVGLDLNGALSSLLPEPAQPEVLRQAWRDSEAILAEWAAETRKRRLPAVAVVIPYVHTLEPHWTSYGRQFTGLEPSYGTSWMEKILHELDIPVISMRQRILHSGMMAREFFLMPHDAHLNFFGHARVADWIVDEMVRQNLIPEPRARSAPSRYDLLEVGAAQAAANGVYPIETLASGKRLCAGPDAASVAFERTGPAKAWLETRLTSEVDDQSMTIFVNGEEIRGLEMSAGESATVRLEFESTPGRNEIRFEFTNWFGKDSPEPLRRRPLAGCFQQLEIGITAR